ncbi:MAG: LEA type 2 family protein [Casimicrobiaceae bacterium]
MRAFYRRHDAAAIDGAPNPGRAVPTSGGAPRLALAAVLAVAACALVPQRIEPPAVALAEVGIERLDANAIRVKLVLELANPNDAEVALDALSFTLALAGRQVADAHMLGPRTLPSRGRACIDVVADSSFEDWRRALDAAVRRGVVAYEIAGIATADGRDLAFARLGEKSLVKLLGGLR